MWYLLAAELRNLCRGAQEGIVAAVRRPACPHVTFTRSSRCPGGTGMHVGREPDITQHQPCKRAGDHHAYSRAVPLHRSTGDYRCRMRRRLGGRRAGARPSAGDGRYGLRRGYRSRHTVGAGGRAPRWSLRQRQDVDVRVSADGVLPGGVRFSARFGLVRACPSRGPAPPRVYRVLRIGPRAGPHEPSLRPRQRL